MPTGKMAGQVSLQQTKERRQRQQGTDRPFRQRIDDIFQKRAGVMSKGLTGTPAFEKGKGGQVCRALRL